MSEHNQSASSESYPEPSTASPVEHSDLVCLDCVGRAVNYALIAEEHGHDAAVEVIPFAYGTWGHDSLISAFPIMPGINVDLDFERAVFQEALINVARHGQPGFWAHAEPRDRAQILCVIDPGDRTTSPGDLSWQARMYLTAWVERDDAFYEFVTNKHAAQWSASEVDILTCSALGYLRRNSEWVEAHSRQDLEDAVRFVHLIALALETTRCVHTEPRPDVRPGPARSNQIRRGAVAALGGVPATVTTACSEVLHQMLPNLASVDGGAFLFWLAHMTIWAGLNGGSDAFVDAAIGYRRP